MTDVLGTILAHDRFGPDRPAVEDLERRLSYAELRHEAAAVAAGLTERGVRDGDRIALFLPNSVEFVVAALACLWVGAMFVPLAVTDPAARLAVILDDCEPALVVTSDEVDGGALPGRPGRPAVRLSQLRGSQARPNPARVTGDWGAYAIYTSGTTGTPKGVLIGTAAFASAVAATAAALGLHGGTRTLCVSPVYFDGSFGTVFPTLFSGGSLVILPRDSLLYPRTFFNAVARHGITYTGFSPSYLRLVLSSKQVRKLADTPLRTVALGGEASSTADVEALWAAAPAIRVFNRYGPTETTIAVTHVELTSENTSGGTVPIGQPHPGVTFYLVDEQDQLIEDPGRVGELYIGGSQLMAGYWRAPDLTAQVLRTDVVPGETVYRTGDLVFRNDAGDFVYVDRADRVIKRSGVRISLVEVTQVVRRLPGVAAAVCVVFDDGGQLGIAAFVVADKTTSALDLLQATRGHLPATMLPDRIELVDSLPLTGSSKVDERGLLAAFGLGEARPAAATSGR